MAPPTTELSGNLLVIKDPDLTLVPTAANGQQYIDFFAAINLVRAAAGEYYDFVSFLVDTPSGMPTGLGAASFSIYNETSGIGMTIYNNRPSFGSTRLTHISYFGQSTPAGVPLFYQTTVLHEIGHRWLAYVDYKDGGGTTQPLLHEDWVWNAGQQSLHWGRWPDDKNSAMGYDQAEWIDNMNGTWSRDQKDIQQPADDQWFGYWDLELYLMGLIPASEVQNFKIVQNPAPTISWGNAGPYTPGAVPTVSAANVVAEEGARNPDYLNSQRVFHHLFVVLSKSTAAASANAFVTSAEGWRKAHTTDFRGKTRGLAVMDTSLLRPNYSDLYVRDNLADTGGGSSSGVFWTSPDLWVRQIQDGVQMDEPAKRGQDNYVYARVLNKSAQAYSNVVVNFYIANYFSLVPGTQFLYPVNWAPGGLIDSVTIPTVPARAGGVDGQAIVSVKWPAAKIPPAAGWHPCLLSEVLPMELAPSTLHYVTQNKKLAQRNITII